MRKFLLTVIVIVLLLFFPWNKSRAFECDQSTIGSSHSQQDWQQIENACTSKISEAKDAENTLKSQIELMDGQIYLTSAKIKETEQNIASTQKEIDTLSTRISGLDDSLSYLSKLLLNRIVQGYKNRSYSIFDTIFASTTAEDLIGQIKYQKTVQDNNQKMLVQVQETKLNFEDQKQLREEKVKQLDNLKATLAQQQTDLQRQQKEKQDLLTETQNSEAVYQNLLNQAKAQLQGFSQFTSSQGGSSILNNQTVCDDWGCYYNQRDTQWGNNSLNGTQYTLASDGCLVTSMAMIYSHYGHRDVTPQTINSNPNNFASYYPAYLKFSIIANGVSSTRIDAAIDSQLSQGNPVVVEISLGGIDYHFVVLISGSNGNYQMNDPYVPNGHNISFTSKYPISSIVAVQKVEF